jgi:hypothetical protein
MGLSSVFEMIARNAAMSGHEFRRDVCAARNEARGIMDGRPNAT